MRVDSRYCPSCNAGFSPTTRKCPICNTAMSEPGASPRDGGRSRPAGRRGRRSGKARARAASADVVVLREAPVAWAQELAAALDAQGVPYELDAELDAPPSRLRSVGGSHEPSCRVLVKQTDLSRALPIDDEVYARQVPESRVARALLDDWESIATGTARPDAATGAENGDAEALKGARGSLLRTVVFVLAMLLFYVLRALLGD